MCLGIFLIYEMNVVARDKLYTKSGAQLHKLFINSFLKRICVVIGILNRRLVALHLKIIVVAKCVFVPLERFLDFLHVTGKNQFRNLATKTCGTNYKTLTINLKLTLVSPRVVIEALSPGLTHQLTEILVALFVFCQYDKVITLIAR